MKTVAKEVLTQTEVKKSKFINYLVPFEKFEEYNKNLRVQNPKANHVVWAYRHINEYDQIVENSSDDGEPKGSSAPAILNVLRGEEMINCALLVVRYFGGVKLGIGGLVRAYGSASKDVLHVASKTNMLIGYEKKEQITFHLRYANVSKFEHFIQNQKIEELAKNWDDSGVIWTLMCNERELDILKTFAKEYERLKELVYM